MDHIEIANLENAGRSAMAWVPDHQEHAGRNPSLLLLAVLPAAAIIGLAATLLLTML